MKYEQYMLMSKEHRQEYDYKFGSNKLGIYQMIFAGICILSSNLFFTFFFGIASLFCYLAPVILEYRWLKEKGYKK